MNQPRRAERAWDNPLAELQALRAELGRLVGSALVGSRGSPDVELTETEGGWTVVARLPGIAPEEVALELDGRDLCIRARSEEEVNADQGMPGTGSRMRSFEHRITLPSQADPDRVDAVMDHGLLTVQIPRAGRSDRRTITIGRTGYGAAQGVGGRSVPLDPATDRELHHPDVGDTTLRQPG